MHLLLLINPRKIDFPNSKPLQGQSRTYSWVTSKSINLMEDIPLCL